MATIFYTFFLSLALCFGHVDELFSFPLSCLCVIILLFYPINLSHINLILRPPTKNLEGQREISSSCILATSHIFLSVFKILNEVFNNKLMAMNVINDFTQSDIRTYFFMFF